MKLLAQIKGNDLQLEVGVECNGRSPHLSRHTSDLVGHHGAVGAGQVCGERGESPAAVKESLSWLCKGTRMVPGRKLSPLGHGPAGLLDG